MISGHTDYVAERVADGEVRYANGEVLPYDLLVTFYVAQVVYPRLPGNDRSFIRTESL